MDFDDNTIARITDQLAQRFEEQDALELRTRKQFRYYHTGNERSVWYIELRTKMYHAEQLMACIAIASEVISKGDVDFLSKSTQQRIFNAFSDIFISEHNKAN